MQRFDLAKTVAICTGGNGGIGAGIWKVPVEDLR